ncbi:serine phosphatase RsbU (regulator of sigma subunit) [Streptacidiphilus sp. MAP12-33]
MGNGIDAGATMGRRHTATRAYADLDLVPAQVRQHLDKITRGLEHSIATCLYAVNDPRCGECPISNAGHRPPVLLRAGLHPELLELPAGAPLGVGGVPFHAAAFWFGLGDRLVLYTDGLVETRHQPIDERLTALLDVLDGPPKPLEETCQWLLDTLRDPDDVTVFVAEARSTPQP